MISRADQPRQKRVLEIAIVVSVALHLLFGSVAMYHHPLIAKMMERVLKEPKEKDVALSTAVTIEKRTKPQPLRPVAPQPPRVPVRPQPRVVPHVAAVPQPKPEPKQPPAPKHTELAKTVRHAPVQPKVVARIAPPQTKNSNQLSADQIAAMQQRFSQTIAAARAAGDPTRVTSPAPPATMKRAHLDIEGVNDILRHDEGILTPQKEWRQTVDGDTKGTCYYVNFYLNFANGGFDHGPVYWPICYARKVDPFANLWRHFPLPPPPPGWTPDPNMWPVIAEHPVLRAYFPDRFPNNQLGN